MDDNRLDTDEENTVEMKDKSEENFQSETWRENKIKISEGRVRYIEDKRRSNIGIVKIKSLGGEKERTGQSNGG